MGLLSFHDPPRIDTKATIEKAIAMGCEVKMITGDHVRKFH
jgi:H+-transporting ATPase